METVTEHRTDVRMELAWPVSMWLPDAHRFINGQSANISKTGVYMNVPLTTPVRAGQLVEINFPRTAALASEKGSYSRIRRGQVVRVERRNMLQNANIGVAVHFE